MARALFFLFPALVSFSSFSQELKSIQLSKQLLQTKYPSKGISSAYGCARQVEYYPLRGRSEIIRREQNSLSFISESGEVIWTTEIKIKHKTEIKSITIVTDGEFIYVGLFSPIFHQWDQLEVLDFGGKQVIRNEGYGGLQVHRKFGAFSDSKGFHRWVFGTDEGKKEKEMLLVTTKGTKTTVMSLGDVPKLKEMISPVFKEMMTEKSFENLDVEIDLLKANPNTGMFTTPDINSNSYDFPFLISIHGGESNDHLFSLYLEFSINSSGENSKEKEYSIENSQKGFETIFYNSELEQYVYVNSNERTKNKPFSADIYVLDRVGKLLSASTIIPGNLVTSSDYKKDMDELTSLACPLVNWKELNGPNYFQAQQGIWFKYNPINEGYMIWVNDAIYMEKPRPMLYSFHLNQDMQPQKVLHYKKYQRPFMTGGLCNWSVAFKQSDVDLVFGQNTYSRLEEELFRKSVDQEYKMWFSVITSGTGRKFLIIDNGETLKTEIFTPVME